MASNTIIQAIKLVTGEELVVEVDYVTDEQTIVNKPLVLHMVPGQRGIEVKFFPWTLIADGAIPIQNHAIVARYAIPKDVEDSYLQNTTGLQIVSDVPQVLHG